MLTLPRRGGGGLSASAHSLLVEVAERLGAAVSRSELDPELVSADAVREYCRALGFAEHRNWAALDVADIAPVGEGDIPLVPADEATGVLEQLQHLVTRGRFVPTARGTTRPDALNDVLPSPGLFMGRRTLGHVDEFRYGLAVALAESHIGLLSLTHHHPLLAGMTVMDHLAEDPLYYARRRVMASQGELFLAQISGGDFGRLRSSLLGLSTATKYLQSRIVEVVRQD